MATTAGIDQNSKPTLTVLSSLGDGSIVTLYANPTTHRLLVDNANSGITLTTTGTSGAATLVGTTLNIPIYASTPGGLNTQMQYNNAGSFGGITGATTDGTVVSLNGAHLLNPTVNGAGAGLATLAYPNTASNATITFPATTGTVALTSQITAGTVTNVSSADANATVATQSTTPVITVVSAPKLQTARTIGGTSFDGTANISIGALSTSNVGNTTSAQLAAVVTDETGTGSLVFGTNPTIAKPVMNATNPTASAYAPSAAGTATLDLGVSNQHDIQMPSGNITIALTNDTSNQIFSVSITQDATGSRTVAWFATIRWAGGSAPVLTTTASKRDRFVFIRTGSGTYDGMVTGMNI